MLGIYMPEPTLGANFRGWAFSWCQPDREAEVIIIRSTYGEIECGTGRVRVAVDGLNRDATIYSSAMFSLRGRTIPAPSGWTKILRGPIGGGRACKFVCVQR